MKSKFKPSAIIKDLETANQLRKAKLFYNPTKFYELWQLHADLNDVQNLEITEELNLFSLNQTEGVLDFDKDFWTKEQIEEFLNLEKI